MSSFTENLYLKRHLKQLQEENLKLKQTINEVYGQGAYPNPNDRSALSRVELKPEDLEYMKDLDDFGLTSEQLIKEYGKPVDFHPRKHSPEIQNLMGAAHVEAGLDHLIPEDDLNFPHYAAGVKRAREFFGLE